MYIVGAPCKDASNEYGKCPKILYIKVADKMACANSADPDQTVPEGAVWSGSMQFAISLCILRTNCIESKIKAKIVWNRVYKIWGLVPYPQQTIYMDIPLIWSYDFLHLNSMFASWILYEDIEWYLFINKLTLSLFC